MSKKYASPQNFLVTGALGCIGAWIVHNLVQENVPVTAFDLGTDPHRMQLMMSPEALARVNFVQGDITNLNAVTSVIKEHNISHIIHLAALQVPACKANPALGARVNVVGTINVFEAARQAGLQRVVYASSVAAYGPKEDYAPGKGLNDQGLITHKAPLNPRTLYGVYKQANEGTARVYFQDHGLSSIGLRPYVLYGPGRDQGMTSTPTKAMLAAAAGKPYHITYGGRSGMQYTDDVAKLFIAVARVPFEGAAVYNVRGSVVEMQEVVAAIEAAVPEGHGTISFEPMALPFPDGQEDTPLQELLGTMPYTPLEQGITQTIAVFKEALAQGTLSAEGL